LRLKKKREEKGLALGDIEKSTKISIRLLKNIEAGDFGELPSGVFARNFIRQYCKAIDVPSEPILEKIFGVEPNPVESEKFPEKESHRGMIGIIIVILLLAGGFWSFRQGVWSRLSSAGEPNPKSVKTVLPSPSKEAADLASHEKPTTSRSKLNTQVADSKVAEKKMPLAPSELPAGNVSSARQLSGEVAVPGLNTGKGLDSVSDMGKRGQEFPVRFETDEKCWIHLRCPEKEMDFILMKGELYSINCSAPALISLGNAEHVRVFVNNEKVIFPAGQRVVKDFVLKGSGENRD